MKKRLAILISGGGTTMQEIIKACQSGEIPMDIACIISSSSSASGLYKARNLGISESNLVIVDPNKFRGDEKSVDQESFGQNILEELGKRGVTVVTQNGWLPLTPENVIEKYSETIFNQHPGPVPEFGGQGMYGRRVHAARLLFTRLTKRDSWTEAIGQRVSMQYDRGEVVKSIKVEILPDDTVEELQMRVLPVEHRVQIELLQDLAAGNLKVVAGRRSVVRPGEEDILILAKKMAKLLYPRG